MSEFEAALRGTMSHQNKGFEQAEADLRAETGAASVGIEKLTNNRGSLVLSPAREQNDGVWYELWLLFRLADQVGPAAQRRTAPTKKNVLGTVFVPRKGYPIRTGSGRELADRAALAAHFVEMAKDPASPLVNYLAFNLRHQQPSPRPFDESDEPELSTEALHLLEEMGKDEEGALLMAKTTEGFKLMAHGRQLCDGGNARIEAAYRDAVDELVSRKLLAPRSDNGESFSLTKRGWGLADELSKMARGA